MNDNDEVLRRLIEAEVKLEMPELSPEQFAAILEDSLQEPPEDPMSPEQFERLMATVRDDELRLGLGKSEV